MSRYYYADTLSGFCNSSKVLQELTRSSEYNINLNQRDVWQKQIDILKNLCRDYEHGHIIMKFDIPRLGRWADVILLIRGVMFVLEFKVGADGVPACRY